jgi:hypothetical protein
MTNESNEVKENVCRYCNGLIEIRNPTGNCDHLYFPENVNKNLLGKSLTNLEKWRSVVFDFKVDVSENQFDLAKWLDSKNVSADEAFEKVIGESK